MMQYVYLVYSVVQLTRDHSEEVDAVESATNISLIYKPIEKLTNKFTVANTYIKRIYAAAPGSKNTAQDRLLW